MSKLWQSLKRWAGASKKQSNPELIRSRYSLVDAEDVNASTLRVWVDLPEEVKNDPSLAQFRQEYEKKHGIQDTKKVKEQLSSANSSSVLSDEIEVLSEDERSGVDELKKDEEETKNKEDNVVARASNKKLTMLSQARHYTKMTVLVSCWMFFTCVFMLYNEKHDVVRNSAITEGSEKEYLIKTNSIIQDVLVKLTGPFLSEKGERKLNSTELKMRHQMIVWFERQPVHLNYSNPEKNTLEKSEIWTIALRENNLDFSKGEERSHILKLKLKPNLDSNHVYAIHMQTTLPRLTPFTLSYVLSPLDVSTGVIYAIILLTGLYILIIFEVINKTMSAVLVATLSLAVLAMVGERPSITEAISWLNNETLVLLFSIMILVAIMAETGVFDFFAVFTFEVTRGKLWPLIYLLCGVTAIMSSVLDNVTTVLLMSPVTIRLCEIMDLDPVPLLMFMTIFSNIGGTATPIGDSPNIIVVSHKDVIDAGIQFTNFTAHMSIGAILVFIQASLQIRYMFRDTNKLRLNVPRDIQDIQHQISIWRRAADSLPHLSKEVNIVRERLEKNIAKLMAKLDVMIKESSKRAYPKETYQRTLKALKGKYKVKDKMLLIKSTIAVVFVMLIFFLNSFPKHNRISLGWTALLGAILLLILADRADLEPILHRVEWSTLIFFAAFFVLVEALAKMGLIAFIGNLIEQLIIQVDERARLATAIVLTLWVAGIISACIDNIPLTTMMVRVVITIQSNSNLNLPLEPLIWALLFGACLGGNATLIAASANVVCAGVAEQHGYKFTFRQFFKIGGPVAVGHLVICTIYLLISHCLFTWH